MLDLPAPKIRAYAMETVIAEKFQAMVALGRANSRMKDFYDIWILSQSFSIDSERLEKRSRRPSRDAIQRSRLNRPMHSHRHLRKMNEATTVAGFCRGCSIDPGSLAQVLRRSLGS